MESFCHCRKFDSIPISMSEFFSFFWQRQMIAINQDPIGYTESHMNASLFTGFPVIWTGFAPYYFIEWSKKKAIR